jgi:4-alpha-glucanotransferase
VKPNSKHGYLPDNYPKNCVAYPGTHDNDTLLGWFNQLDESSKNDVLKYLKIKDSSKLNDTVIKRMMDSNADRVVFTIQDVLGLDTQFRMNTPGTAGIHNWSWRLVKKQLTKTVAAKLKKMVEESDRS